MRTLASLAAIAVFMVAAPARSDIDQTDAQEAEMREARRAHRMKEDVRDCTFKGQLSQICVDVREATQVNAGRNQKYTADYPEHIHAVRNCFDDAARNEARGETTSYYAEEIVRDRTPVDKLVAECFRVTALYGGKAWRAGTDKLAGHAEWVASVGEKVAAGFKRKCGVEGKLEEVGVQLAVERQTRSKKVFLKTRSPDGDAVTLYCSGKVVTTYRTGGKSTSPGRTMAAVRKDDAIWSCIQRCAKTHPRCPSHNFTEKVCDKACRAECTAEIEGR